MGEAEGSAGEGRLIPQDEWIRDLAGAHDVGHLTYERRLELGSLLDEYGVFHRYVGPELQATPAEAELIEDLIAYVGCPLEDRPSPPSPLGRLAPQVHSRLAAALAPRWRRLLAYLAEWVAVAVFALGATTMVPDSWYPLVAVGLGTLSGLVLVALTGRTAGMWLFGMRIVVPPSVAPPGWSTATRRFLTANGPGLALFCVEPVVPTDVFQVLRGANMVWLLLCFGPILFDQYRRGIHDRVARTMVVYVDSTGPLD